MNNLYKEYWDQIDENGYLKKIDAFKGVEKLNLKKLVLFCRRKR